MPLAAYVRTVEFTNREATFLCAYGAYVREEETCTRVHVVSSRRAYLVDVVRRACAIGINVLPVSCPPDGLREFKASARRAFAESTLSSLSLSLSGSSFFIRSRRKGLKEGAFEARASGWILDSLYSRNCNCETITEFCQRYSFCAVVGESIDCTRETRPFFKLHDPRRNVNVRIV